MGSFLHVGAVARDPPMTASVDARGDVRHQGFGKYPSAAAN
jgi:hypothetical protein